MSKNVIVVGAGIVGLATARAMAVKGYSVTVIERSHMAVGASIRNFGMIWPVGQPDGELYERAMLSRGIWKQVCSDAKIWYDEVGSLHLAYEKDEWQVMNEFVTAVGANRNCRLLNVKETKSISNVAVTSNLFGSLWSPDEMIVDPRKAIASIPVWLKEKYNVDFIWGKAVSAINYPSVHIGSQNLKGDLIFVCSGADFETLYPELYSSSLITKCKLQMMRLETQADNQRIGPALCGALSLIHYNSFAIAPSIASLKSRFENELSAYLSWGIHVMAAQNQEGQITVGDSHEYASTHDPFDKQLINQLILAYLNKFAQFNSYKVMETWNGVYPKLKNGESHFTSTPEEGVIVINGLGGAGMTLSFGLCEELCSKY